METETAVVFQSLRMTEEVDRYYLKRTLAPPGLHDGSFVRLGNRCYLWQPDFPQNHLEKKQSTWARTWLSLVLRPGVGVAVPPSSLVSCTPLQSPLSQCQGPTDADYWLQKVGHVVCRNKIPNYTDLANICGEQKQKKSRARVWFRQPFVK